LNEDSYYYFYNKGFADSGGISFILGIYFAKLVDKNNFAYYLKQEFKFMTKIKRALVMLIGLSIIISIFIFIHMSVLITFLIK